MDKFKIDSHKYAYHPDHSANVINYIRNKDDKQYIEAFKNQHPLYMELSPVGACNHRCTFCAVDYIGYNSVFMDLEVYKKTIDSMKTKGCKSIMFAGEGEPLLHPEISEFVNYTKIEGGIDTSFTTNAFKLSENFVEKSLSNIAWVKVSFNAGTSKAYSEIHRTKEKDFDVVCNNLRYAVEYKNKHGLKVALGMQMLLLPENQETLHDLCNLAIDIGLDYVVIKPYSQHKFSNTTKYKNIDYTQYLGLEEELKQYNSKNFNVVFRINTINNWISQNNERYCHCMATPSVWSYIMADGEVYSCSAYLLDDRFKLGNINEATFHDIWSSERRMKHAHYVMNELDINECRVNCRMDQVNRYLDNVVNEKIDHINFV
ncbi:radical SAM protein [Prochlorococcus sp. MIT 1306]|uniref:radical SAM/SPASM domain-containing protein n=1 Tax=Prochlorococcus sp. MIT 1306 TaxID=1799667 RepID=UPI0007B3DB28|nr:radical SAM protein [Prochlorococcus sp. MIT 1306]